MSSVTRTWSVPPSPRNPYKLCDELGLLKKFEGQIWNKGTQTNFALELSKADFFEGTTSATMPDFSARDRINRSPKTFGFIRFDDARKVQFTPAGNQLIAKIGLEDLFLRQLLKWQYPSPNHDDAAYQAFRIKPFLEVLRLARELDGISKKEIAIFGVSLIDYRNFDETAKSIIDFRRELALIIGKRDRHVYEQRVHLQRFKEIYKEDITNGNIPIRESSRTSNVDIAVFLKTKMRNSFDYAGAAINYFRATGIFSLSSRNYRLRVMDTKVGFVDTILTQISREPEPFTGASRFLDFLGDSSLPSLPDDDIVVLREYTTDLLRRIVQEAGSPLEGYSETALKAMSLLQLKEAKTALEEYEGKAAIEKQTRELQTYGQYDDIVETFEKIQDRKDIDIPDKPLFFEWNIWRALTMLDDGAIRAHLKFDAEGKPFSGAPSKTADIVCEYVDFVVVVEVTLMSGHKQYEAEGEPVARHVSEVRKKLVSVGDQRPVFGLFIAAQVSEATASYFFVLRHQNVAYYGGRLDIVPVNLADFLNVLQKAKNIGGVKSSDIRQILEEGAAAASSAKDEKDWQVKINTIIQDWTPVSV